MNVVAIIKGAEQYVVVYEKNDDSAAVALRQARKWAADKSLPNFTWSDADAMSDEIRLQISTQRPTPGASRLIRKSQ